MSLESALDEERREILKLLEGPVAQRPPRAPATTAGLTRAFGQDGRTSSPVGARSPVRSMLDVASDAPVRQRASFAAPGGAEGSAGSRPSYPGGGVRSMLDPMASPPPARSTPPGNKARPSAPQQQSASPRSRSDAASHPPEPTLRPTVDKDRAMPDRPGHSPNSDYQFDILPASQAGALPKRVTQGRTQASTLSSSKSSALRSNDLGGAPTGRGIDRGRNSIAGTGVTSHGSSASPSSRFSRSKSPHTSKLNNNSLNLMPTPGKFVGNSGQVVDLGSAYRRLSDVYLARSAGSLSSLPARTGPEHIRADSGEVLSPSGEVRLQKDYYGQGENEEAAVESSDEESYGSSDEDWSSDARRGRKRSRKRVNGPEEKQEWEENEDGSQSGAKKSESTVGMGQARGPRKTLSLLAAAEEERKSVSSKYQVRSLLTPPLTVTGPEGDRSGAKKAGVHPTTSFDRSGISTPMASDTEAELSDIKRAQRMHLSLSPANSTPESHRVIRTIIRGEFSKMQQEADEGLRRQRTYLVATDLSDEAAHALEWTIGTVLRDGDTLLAIYAVNEESGTGKSGDSDSVQGVAVGEGALSVHDQAAVVDSQTAKAAQQHATAPSPLSTPSLQLGRQSVSASASPESRQRSKAEQERLHVAGDITQRCIKLLRKTRLQVRVVIEVIHCKSPKHLITEVIDFIDPTLVILGSRGRSALKGVLLGSFSNYLVTKSSVPVMVARKRLRKHSKKYKHTNVRLSNNLTPAKSLAAAKVDELTRY